MSFFTRQSHLHIQSSFPSDRDLLRELNDNLPSAWERLYDLYSTSMFGLISTLTTDHKLTEEIFTNAFLGLRNSSFLQQDIEWLCPSLMKYTLLFTLDAFNLKTTFIKQLTVAEEDMLIHFLNRQGISVEDITNIIGLPQNHVSQVLHKELKQVRLSILLTKDVYFKHRFLLI